MSCLSTWELLALAYGLEHEDGGRHGDVEGVADAQHRNLDVSIGCLAPLVGESCSFSTHDDGGGAHHIGLIIVVGVLQLGSKNLDTVFLEPLDARFRGARYGRYAEEGTNRGADDVGVVEVALWVTDNDGIDMGGIGRAQDGTHIARFLDTLQDDYQGGFAQVELVKGVLLGNDLGNDTLSTTAICHLIIYVGGELEDTGSINHRLLSAINLWTPEEGVYPITALDTTLYLSPTLNDKQSVTAALLRLLLQFEQQLYLRILSTGDDVSHKP